MDKNKRKKVEKNCQFYSSPVAADLSLKSLGQQALPPLLNKYSIPTEDFWHFRFITFPIISYF